MDREHRRTSTNLKRYNPAADPASSLPPSHFLDLPSASQPPPPHGNDQQHHYQYDHYHNHEHRPQRRRMESPWHQQPAQRHYPRDGYDFRTPVMSEQNGFNMDWMNNEQNTIDLTGDRHAHNNPPQMRLALPSAPGGASAGASGPSSRTQRGPRFDRNIINLDNSDEEDHTGRQMQHHTRENPIPGQSAAPAEESLFIPDTSNEHSLFTASTQRRPTTSGLRPGYMRHYPTAAGLDEVQVVATRSLSRHPSQRSTPTLPRPDETANDAGSTTIDLTADDDDDDVIHTSTRTLPGINGDRPAMAGSGIGTRERPTFGLAHLAQAMRAQGASPTVLDRFQGLGTANRDDPVARARAHQRHTRDVAIEARQRRENIELAHGIHGLRVPSRLGLAARLERRTPEATGAAQPAHRRRPGQARMFIDLDFGMAAFDMGYGEPARPATPKYEAPPPAEKGFTRSPEEDEEVVCPNCGDELAVSEDETKSQVWVIKACGHAYCGECATRRAAPASKKGKGRAVDPSIPPPIKKCVVVGCEKSVSKQWIHVYMSS